MPTPTEQFADLIFPRAGIDLTQAFAGQLPGTTILGKNVRTFEALTQRGRGGSRPGLLKYIPAQLPTHGLIQHLNVIVDPDGTATGDTDDGNFPDPSDPGPPSSWGNFHTRNPGRKIRNGGNGYMRFKNRKRTLVITANNQNKTQGTLFVFQGTEFTLTGTLDILDSVTVTFTCAGAPAIAVPGTYPIVPSAAVFVPNSSATKYSVQYANGTMTIAAGLVQGTLLFSQSDIGWSHTCICPPAGLSSRDPSNPGQTFQQEINLGLCQVIGTCFGRPGSITQS